MKIVRLPIIACQAFFFLLVLVHSSAYSQNSTKNDSAIIISKDDNRFIDPNNKGVSLIKEEKFEEANQFFSAEIKKDESNRDAYFNRGVVRWNLNDASNACRDWSAVLALGDTETFKLLDKNCHGSMVIDEDTITSVVYHKMFTPGKKDAKTSSANSTATTIADEMPEFNGGTDALLAYLQKAMKYPESARSHGISGRVYVNFIVSRKGKILFPYVIRGIGSGCNEEAVRVIKNMPPWKPGKQKGKPVPVRYNLPVNFSLR